MTEFGSLNVNLNLFLRFDETFSEASDRFKYLLHKFPHHGFSELHQIDTFYNALTQSDQDSLNAAADGNLLNRTPRDALTIIENKSKIVKELVLMNKATQQATVKAIEETCVTCGGPHPYYECHATGGNTFDACAAVGTYNQGGDLKAITTQSSVAYDGPTIPPTSSPLSKEVKRESKETKDKESVNRIDVIDVSCEEYAQEVPEFSDSSTSGNPTPLDPIITSSFPSFTPFEGSDFILEKIETFLRTPDELTNLDDDYYDTEAYSLP
nr:reverse transcriptase domain-containing protein [Tanacetum cinerariifolium]